MAGALPLLIATDIVEILRKHLQNNAEKCPQDPENRGIRMMRGGVASATVAKH